MCRRDSLICFILVDGWVNAIGSGAVAVYVCMMCLSHLFRSDFFTCSLVLLPQPGSPTHTPCPWLQYSPHHWHILVHSKLDYCNSLYCGLPKTQLTRLQHIQNSLARTVVAAPRSSDPDQILKSLHWYRSTLNTKLFLPLITVVTYTYSLPVHITFAISLPSSLHDPLGHRHWSLSFTHKLSRVSKSLTTLFGMWHLTYRTDFLHLFSRPPQSTLLHRQALTLLLNR